MKKIKRAAAAAAAIAMAVAASSCGKTSSTTDSSSSMPEKKLKEDQQEIVQRLADSITDARELSNTEIRWFSFYDINPTESEDKEIGVDLALFQTKYDGKIKYISTIWDNYFTDLATLVMSDQSPDFIGLDDMNVFPKAAIKNMIDPVDDYINFDDPLWADVKEANEQFMYQGKHYGMITRVDPAYIFIYNRNTIEENGYDDPADLYHEGNWNWDTFSEMCLDFANAEEDKYALDAWYYDTALMQSSGKPLISMENGQIVNNITSAELEKAENMMYELQKNEVVYPKHLYDWKVRGDTFGIGVASGLTLFYPIGFWAIEDAPSVTEPYGDISAGDVMFVPTPCAKDSDAMYVPSRVHGYAICHDAPNPEGVAAWMDCTRYAETDEAAHGITLDQLQNDYGWTDEMLEMRDEIYALAAEHPVFDFSQGISDDLAKSTDNVLKGVMHPSDPKTWATVVQENQASIDWLIEDAQKSLDN